MPVPLPLNPLRDLISLCHREYSTPALAAGYPEFFVLDTTSGPVVACCDALCERILAWIHPVRRLGAMR